MMRILDKEQPEAHAVLLSAAGLMAGVVCLAVTLSGCNNEPEATQKTTNSNFEVERLFTADGCTVYRFWDRQDYHYFVACPGTGSTETQRRVGKTYVTETIPTGVAP